MKKMLIAIAILVGTWLVGYLVGRQHFRDVTKMIQIDTTYVYNTAAYSKLDLVKNTYELDIPKSTRVPVLIPIENTDTVVKENNVYVAMEREYRYTETEDVQIWHSGIDSTIDSLNVFKKSMTISKMETLVQKPSPWHYSLDFAVNYGRTNTSFIQPGIGAEIGYKRLSIGAEAGVSLDILNSSTLKPNFYWQLGLKYTIWGK